MEPIRLFICGIIVSFNFTLITCFNLDTKVPIVKEGISNSYFGFSVAQHQVTNTRLGSSAHVLLVGAPLDNVTDSSVPQEVRNLKSPGVIYQCPFSSFTDDCQYIKLDADAPSAGTVKDGQWLGVSVSSQGTAEGQAVACAHKYTQGGNDYRWGLGICISMTNTLDEGIFLEACSGLPKNKVHEDYGMCQAGTSVVVDEQGDVLLGAPGSRNWRGAAFKNSIEESVDADQTWYHSAADNVDKKNPGPPPAVRYYSYLGMSSEIATVINDQKTFIAGAPRSEDVGQVLMFLQGNDSQLSIDEDHYLTGEQFGSWFGNDVTVVDLNHDGKEDLVVGAPFYTKVGIGGAIYVYMNGPKGITSKTKPVKITSRAMSPRECDDVKCQNARFGFSVENIGDVDRDGYEDIAVGAPYEGNGAGAVYIFRGSKDGIITTPSQHIKASDLQSARPLTSFGYSLSGGNDMDGNTYPDLLVGSFESEKAVVLRARPVIKITAILQFIPDRISTKNTQCPKDGRKENCFEVRACFRFTALPKSEFRGSLDITYKLEADKFTGRVKSRVFFKSPDPVKREVIERDLTLRAQESPDSLTCIEHLVYIDKNNKDFLNPIPFRLTYKLKDVDTPTMNPGDNVPPFNTYPILNEQMAELNKSLSFENNCGDDNKCQSNLVVTGTFPSLPTDSDSKLPLLKVGEVNQLKLRVNVYNQGEDAHESMLYITLPEELSYVGTGEQGRRQVYSCSPQGKLVVCNLGNPLKEGKAAAFIVRLDTSKIPPTTPNLTINMFANTTSEESDPRDDSVKLNMRVVVETDLFIRGSSDPLEVFYGGEIRGETAIQYENEIGFQVIHSYEVNNLGRGQVKNTKVVIDWPYEVTNPGHKMGKHLLYLMEEPLVDPPGTGTCTTPDYAINPLKIREDRDLKLQYSWKQRPSYNITDDEETGGKRKKRQTVVAAENIRDSSGNVLKVVTLDCDRETAKCFKIHCTIDDSVVIKLRARLWNSTFLEDYKNVDSVHIYSKATLELDPALNIKEVSTDNNVARALTKAIPDIQVQDSPGVPLWAIIVAAVAGVLLLVLIVIILWKCGFFQRRRHPDDMKTHKGKLQKQNYDDAYYN